MVKRLLTDQIGFACIKRLDHFKMDMGEGTLLKNGLLSPYPLKTIIQLVLALAKAITQTKTVYYIIIHQQRN